MSEGIGLFSNNEMAEKDIDELMLAIPPILYRCKEME